MPLNWLVFLGGGGEEGAKHSLKNCALGGSFWKWQFISKQPQKKHLDYFILCLLFFFYIY